MASYQEDIASKLLHSSDARIAEAAKRVFSFTLPVTATLAVFSAAPPSTADNAFEDSPQNQSTRVQQNGRHQSCTPVLKGGTEHTTYHVGTIGPADIDANDEVLDDQEENELKPSSTERLIRSRERNRMHARKTRQRKKEHMQKLQNRADELKVEHIRLKQAINEKNTASILVGLFQTGDGGGKESDGNGLTSNPKVEMLLKRSIEDIPDASKIPELPALILPGQHNGKRKSTDREGDGDRESLLKDSEEDGIDYALLGKDRSSCSPAELDQIRRERNRMHAKRTRDRKRIFMEEMEVVIKRLEDENSLLQGHLTTLDADPPPAEGGSDVLPPAAAESSASLPQTVSPALGPMATPSSVAAATSNETNDGQNATRGDFLNQIESLLAAAGSFQKKSVECEMNAISCAESDVTSSTNHSDHDSSCEEEDDYQMSHKLLGSQSNKRQRRMTSDLSPSVPKSITMTSISLG